MDVTQRIYAKRAKKKIAFSNQLYWFKRKNLKNFGDEVGPYLFERISGRSPEFALPATTLQPTFMSVGSILHKCSRMSVVWGSGMLTHDCSFPRPLSATAVRGPITAARFNALGYDTPEVFGDPALLLPLFCRSSEQQTYEIGIVPNYIEKERVKALAAQMRAQEEVIVIDPEGEVEDVVRRLTSCKCLVSSSLHGWIVGNAYGIPTAWIKSSDKVYGDGVKYIDYYQSVGIKQIAPLTWRDIRNRTMNAISETIRSFEQPVSPPDNQLLLAVCPFPKLMP